MHSFDLRGHARSAGARAWVDSFDDHLAGSRRRRAPRAAGASTGRAGVACSSSVTASAGPSPLSGRCGARRRSPASSSAAPRCSVRRSPWTHGRRVFWRPLRPAWGSSRRTCARPAAIAVPSRISLRDALVHQALSRAHCPRAARCDGEHRRAEPAADRAAAGNRTGRLTPSRAARAAGGWWPGPAASTSSCTCTTGSAHDLMHEPERAAGHARRRGLDVRARAALKTCLAEAAEGKLPPCVISRWAPR